MISFIVSLFLFEQQQFGVCLFEFRSFFLSLFIHSFIYLYIYYFEVTERSSLRTADVSPRSSPLRDV